MTIHEILKLDSQFRTEHLQENEDLHTIDKLISDKTLDYDFPTMVGRDFDYNKTIKLCNNIDDFKTKFYALYPFLAGLDLTNMLIGGGSVGNVVKMKNERFGYANKMDIDFFVYGLSIQDGNKRVVKWVTDVIECAKNYADVKHAENEAKNSSSKKTKVDYERELDCNMIRNNNTLLIQICGHSLQLIFRLYKNKSQILHGFDLGSSAVGFDGENVYLTSLGKFCYEHSCNIVDSTRRSTTYEFRLEKYFKRGFNIVLPSLDISKLRKQYFKYKLLEVCGLPYFTFSYNDIVGNKIIVNDFYNKYSETSDYKLEDVNEYNSFNMNIYNLVHDVDFYYYTSSSIDATAIDILTKQPRISKGSIVSFYEVLRKNLNHKNINVPKLKQFIPDVKASIIAMNMIENNDPNYLNNLIDSQINIVLGKLTLLQNKDHSAIRWITKNPGTQLCGSFNPIFEEESKWYGEYYTTTNVSVPTTSFQDPISISSNELKHFVVDVDIDIEDKDNDSFITVCDNCNKPPKNCECCPECGDYPCDCSCSDDHR